MRAPQTAVLAFLIACIAREASAQSCSPGYRPSLSGTSCVKCSGNTVSPGGTAPCTSCGTRATANSAKTACVCKTGFAGTAPACATCVAGYGGSSCSKCSGNNYSPGGTAACTSCGARATANTGNTACTCKAGFTGTAPDCGSCLAGYGGTNCSKCSGNTYSAGGSYLTTTCATCGYRATAINSNTACACNAGATGTAPACETCKAGYGGTTCSKCTNNNYSAGGPAASTTCQTCGTRATATSNNTACTCLTGFTGPAPSCLSCIAGYGGPSCTKCTGNYASAGGPSSSTSCVLCGIRATAVKNNTACSCNEGANGTAPACDTCKAGYGGSSCTKCTGNNYSSGGPSTSTTCVTCGTRATAVNNNTACACNEGATGAVPACSTCKAGFAGSYCTKCTGNTYSPGGPTTTTCLSCGTLATAINNNSACQCIPGSAGTAPACTCLPGYGGTICAKCTGNTFSANGEPCQTCPTGAAANTGNTACACTNANQEVYNNACVDKCPAAAPRNAQGVCTCPVAGQVLVNGACVAPCPSGQQRASNGTCVCTEPSLVVTSNGCVAACPSGQTYNAAGVCACTNTTIELVNGACVLPEDNTLWQRDYAALISGIAPTDDLAFGDLGYPGEIALYGTAFPVILTSQNKTAMAAGRANGGRVVVFNKEGYMERNTDAALMGAAVGKLLANAVRWVGGGSATIRVAGLSSAASYVQAAGIANLQAAATKQGFTITYPDGRGAASRPYELPSTSGLFAANGSRAADVFMTHAQVGWSDADVQNVVNFIKAGGGFLTGGQAWYHSYTKPIADFRSNVLLKSFNTIQWTTEGVSGDAIYHVPASAPGPLFNFNADVAGAALAKHYSGTQILDANSLNIVTRIVATAVRATAGLDDTPTTFASAGTWRSFNGTVAKAMFNLAKTWDCTKIDSSKGESHLAAAYIGKANQELGPDSMAPATCSLNYPNFGVTLIPDATPVTVTIKANYPDQTQQLPWKQDYTWLSTGIYAVAGAPLTITLPASVAAQLNSSQVIGVQIGSHTDSISHKATWCRLPQDNVKRAWFTAASAGTMRIATNQGGLVYILIKRLVMFGDVDVTLAGGVRAPFFLKGRHTNEQWVSTIRNYPAPWAEIGNDRYVMTIPSSYVRAITDPQKIADMYDMMMDGIADLAVYPRDRPNNERLVLDCDISAGWLHSGYPVMGYLSQAPDHLSANIGDPAEINKKWGTFHELGHNHQIGEMTVRYTGEITCNLWSVYLMETVMKVNRTLRDTNRKNNALSYFQSGTYSTSYDSTNGLIMYMQLQENFVPGNITAGWDVMKAILRKYQDLIGQVNGEDERVQRWIVETSTASGQNLIPYFEQWKWPVTDATRATIAGLGLSPIKFDPKDPCASGSLNACSPSKCCANDYT